jgi:hypothetical protein
MLFKFNVRWLKHRAGEVIKFLNIEDLYFERHCFPFKLLQKRYRFVSSNSMFELRYKNRLYLVVEINVENLS